MFDSLSSDKSVFPPFPNLQLENIMSKSIFKVIYAIKTEYPNTCPITDIDS